MFDLAEIMKSQLALFSKGKIKIHESEILTDLVDQIIKAHGRDSWVESGFPGLKQLSVEDALKYLSGESFKLNDRFLKADDLEVGMFVIMHHSKFPRQHLWGHSYRIAGVEFPYVLLEPAVKAINDQELMVMEFNKMALKKCSESYFQAQRNGNRSDKTARKDYKTDDVTLPF
ncbi:MAG: hypothetical protein ACKO16_03015 [Gemmataceae bacterium]